MINRRYRRYSPWHDMNHLRSEMNRLFNDYTPTTRRRAYGYPAMNVWSNEEQLTITSELPGVEIEDIDISVAGNALTLSGELPKVEDENIRYHRRERKAGNFTRSIELPFPVNADKVEAKLANGVLTITLPRAEEDKPKKIEVKVG